jgi:hypothetical protein
VDILSAVARHVKRDESVCLSRTANDRVGYQKKTTIATSMIHAAVGMDGVRVGPQISKKSAKAAAHQHQLEMSSKMIQSIAEIDTVTFLLSCLFCLQTSADPRQSPLPMRRAQDLTSW